jgi:hypothetical protein
VRGLLAGIVVAVALGVVACGGSGGGHEGLSAAQVIVRGDRACAETQDDFEDIDRKRIYTRGEAVRKGCRLAEESGDQIQALELLADQAPDRMRTDLTRYVAALHLSRRNIQELKAAAVRDDVSGYRRAQDDYLNAEDQHERLARAVGLSECGLPRGPGRPPTGTTGPSGRSGTTGPEGPTRTGCEPGYSKCLDPTASDYDCIENEGDGPKYVQGPIRVTGSDRFRLDGNNNGVGCE